MMAWMGSTQFLTKTLPKVTTEMSLRVLAYGTRCRDPTAIIARDVPAPVMSC
jgi:hypothetical protein